MHPELLYLTWTIPGNIDYDSGRTKLKDHVGTLFWVILSVCSARSWIRVVFWFCKLFSLRCCLSWVLKIEVRLLPCVVRVVACPTRVWVILVLSFLNSWKSWLILLMNSSILLNWEDMEFLQEGVCALAASLLKCWMFEGTEGELSEEDRVVG